LAALLELSGTNHSTAAIIFESGTLGATGVTWSDLTSGAVPGTNIKDVVFTGVRFQLNQPVLTTQIGGHFVAQESGTFFGAIVELDDENDFPDSSDLTTSDVLGHTLLTFPVSSDEVFGDLNLSLDQGWYALVFGSGLFEATTNGGAVRNGTDIGEPIYIAFQPGSGWFNLFDLSDAVKFVNHRFVVLGNVIPEPTSLGLVMIATLCCVLRRTQFTRI
jgi:hypothetical protein